MLLESLIYWHPGGIERLEVKTTQVTTVRCELPWDGSVTRMEVNYQGEHSQNSPSIDHPLNLPFTNRQLP